MGKKRAKGPSGGWRWSGKWGGVAGAHSGIHRATIMGCQPAPPPAHPSTATLCSHVESRPNSPNVSILGVRGDVRPYCQLLGKACGGGAGGGGAERGGAGDRCAAGHLVPGRSPAIVHAYTIRASAHAPRDAPPHNTPIFFRDSVPQTTTPPTGRAQTSGAGAYRAPVGRIGRVSPRRPSAPGLAAGPSAASPAGSAPRGLLQR